MGLGARTNARYQETIHKTIHAPAVFSAQKRVLNEAKAELRKTFQRSDT